MSQDKECTGRQWSLLEIEQAERSGTYVFAVERRSHEWRSGSAAGGRLELAVHLVGGPGADVPGRQGRFVGSLGGSYEDRGTGDALYVLTGGNMLLDEDVRGLRLGSYLQNEVVRWVLDKSRERPGRIKPIGLSAGDARTEAQRDRRNRFYEQFGIAFDWGPPVDGIAHANGRSRDALTTADLRARREVHGVRVLEMLPGLRELVGKARDAKADAERADRARRNGGQETAVMHAQRNIAWAVAAVALMVALLAAGLAGRAYALGSAALLDVAGAPDLALMMGAMSEVVDEYRRDSPSPAPKGAAHTEKDAMEVQLALADAFAAAMPGFGRPMPDAAMPMGDPDETLTWIEAWLGEDVFVSYVEWKEFDSWGLDSVRGLEPVKASGVGLSLDALYGEDGMPLFDGGPFGLFDPGDVFVPELNRQLAAHGLQLAALGLLENPRLVCIGADTVQVDGLTDALNAAGIDLLVYPVAN